MRCTGHSFCILHSLVFQGRLGLLGLLCSGIHRVVVARVAMRHWHEFSFLWYKYLTGSWTYDRLFGLMTARLCRSAFFCPFMKIRDASWTPSVLMYMALIVRHSGEEEKVHRGSCQGSKVRHSQKAEFCDATQPRECTSATYFYVRSMCELQPTFKKKLDIRFFPPTKYDGNDDNDDTA